MGSWLADGAAGGGADLIKTPPMRSHSTTAARTGGVSTSPISSAAAMAATRRRLELVSQPHQVVQTRLDGAGRDAQCDGSLGLRELHQIAPDHHFSQRDGQSPDAGQQLLAPPGAERCILRVAGR
jgi:hypothetical protein